MTQKQARDKLVKALRSGDYKQTIGCLRSFDDHYCCLGVACDIYSKEKLHGFGWVRGEAGNNAYGFISKGQNAYLPNEVKDFFGFRSNDASVNPVDSEIIGYRTSLMTANDGGLSFEVIANAIESGAVELAPVYQ